MQTSLKKSRLMIVEKVERNDELLTEILVRLPPKSIFKCRCVSKRWKDIIDHPYFRESYRAIVGNRRVIGRLLALVQGRSIFGRSRSHHPIINIMTVIQENDYKFKLFPCIFGDIVLSSGGLVLCYKYPLYTVVNPLNRTWVPFPQPGDPRLENLALVCEENTLELIPNFKVVGIDYYRMQTEKHHMVGDGKMILQTYSSKTKEWTMLKLDGTEGLDVGTSHKAFVYNGLIYWHIRECRIVVYDSNRDENCVQLINLPPARPQYLHVTRPFADDFLWVGMSVREGYGLRETVTFWKVPIDDNGTTTDDKWILMHTINNDDLCKEIASLLESTKKKKSFNETVDDKAADHLRFLGLIPLNPPVAVLKLRKKIFLYNLKSKSLEVVRYRGRPYGDTRIMGWHLLMEPIHLSTCGPLAHAYE